MADLMLFRVSSRILADSRRNILKPRKKWDNCGVHRFVSWLFFDVVTLKKHDPAGAYPPPPPFIPLFHKEFCPRKRGDTPGSQVMRLARIYAAFPLICPQCRAAMQIIVCIAPWRWLFDATARKHIVLPVCCAPCILRSLSVLLAMLGEPSLNERRVKPL